MQSRKLLGTAIINLLLFPKKDDEELLKEMQVPKFLYSID